MLGDARGDGEDVGVENDVLRWKSNLTYKNLIRAFTYADLVGEGGSLSLFVEGHDHDCGPVAEGEAGLFLEDFLTFF